MKHLFFLIIALSIAGTSSARSLHFTSANHGPLLVIDTTNSNFGAVPNRGYATRTFMLKNAGDAPLHISHVQPTCGCTIAALGDSIVAPGKATDLKVRLSAAYRQPGNFYKTIAITSNSMSGETSWLKFYGHYVDIHATSAQK